MAAKTLEEYEAIERRLYDICGDDLTLDGLIDYWEFSLAEPSKPNPLVAKILTYEDAKKWEKWKRLNDQGLLLELPCKPGDTVWRLCGTKGRRYVSKREVDGIAYFYDFWVVAHQTACDVLGDRVFLTLEAAEEARRRKEKEDEQYGRK